MDAPNAPNPANPNAQDQFVDAVQGPTVQNQVQGLTVQNQVQDPAVQNQAQDPTVQNPVGMASKLTSKVAEPSKTSWSPPRTKTPWSTKVGPYTGTNVGT